MLGFLSKLIDANARELKRLQPIVEAINAQEASVKMLSEKALKKKTDEFKTRLEGGETLETILPEAYACVREASRRTNKERHFDVQLLAGIVLHQGRIAEQKTGEGKTLSAAPALYLNSLTGRGVHLVTVNDYLSRRDAGWMGPIYHTLGVSVAAIAHESSFLYDPTYTDENVDDPRLRHLKPIARKEAYAADITYGTNNEFGFDYLRDNMVWDRDRMVQRGHHYAIVDEVDSILIDEARTPLIISAPDTEPTEKYMQFAQLIEGLSPATDYTIDEKAKTAALTEHGITKVEKRLGVKNLYEKDFETLHHIEQALRAKTLFARDRDYVVRDGQVIIVDEFTGRLMFGRRYSEGLHQAIEAREGVKIQQESRTLATISFQNYFRMYEKLAGMTGTAATEAEEFHKIYTLDVVVVPTHRPMIRKDYPDQVYKTQTAKYTAVANEVAALHKKGRPVLIGTTSIEKNEIVSALLKRKGVPHEVLNAKNHLREALIIEKAGQKGAVTVATNMAGRGVDIKLGHGVEALGGLAVIGTERHESRRIDNQLRGRSGRQGDHGSSRFYVALDDDIMRLFGGEQVARLMTALKIPDNVPIEHGMVSKAIENAQRKVEGHHFDIRKHLVEYDDVMNRQREIIYERRRKALEGESLREEFRARMHHAIEESVMTNTMEEGVTKEGVERIVREFAQIIPFDDKSQLAMIARFSTAKDSSQIKKTLQKIADDVYEKRERQVGDEHMRNIEKLAALSALDRLWMDHLDAVDDLREGIGLRGYAQRDPLVEYKAEAFSMFERLMADIDHEMIRRLFRIDVRHVPRPVAQPQQLRTNREENGETKEVTSRRRIASSSTQQPVIGNVRTDRDSPAKPQRSKKKLGRNDPCPCGSGKKWKKCHLNREPQTLEERDAYNLFFNNHEEWLRRYGKKKN